MSQYKLIPVQDLQLDDGRNFAVGHPADALDIFEASELLENYAEYFEAGNDLTAELMSDKEKIAHYAEAAARKRADQIHAGITGAMKASRQ